MQRLVVFSMFFFSFALSSFVSAKEVQQQNIQEGKEFWLCFMSNYKDPSEPDESTRLTQKLFITSSFNANIKVQISSLNINRSYSIKPDSILIVDIDPKAEVSNFEIPQDLGIHVTSDKSISIYGYSHRLQTTDTYTALPMESIGKEYVITSTENNMSFLSEFAIVATEDNTLVSIIPSTVTVTGKFPNTPFEIRLNKGQVYAMAAYDFDNPEGLGPSEDFSSTKVSSDKPISVFSGHQCAYVPRGVLACNHNIEQLFPVNQWGNEFIIGKLLKRSLNSVKIMPFEDNTDLRINSKWIDDIGVKNYYHDSTQSAPLHVETSHPVQVIQYSQGFRNGDSIGDPMMMTIRPTKYYRTSYTILTPAQGNWRHYINVYILSEFINKLKLDGKPVDKINFTDIQGTKFSVGTLEIQYGLHHLDCTEPFGINQYGIGYGENEFDSYGNF